MNPDPDAGADDTPLRINARQLQEADQGTRLEVLPPVLFNTFKHHAGALRERIAQFVAGGGGPVALMGAGMAVLGTKLMDLYTGDLWPRDISQGILDALEATGQTNLETYRNWLAGQSGYAVLDLDADGSRWVVRLGDESGRWVHLHPGRWSPHSIRVRANVLKTAVLCVAQARIQDRNPMDRDLINEVREGFLGLSPLGEAPAEENGLGVVIELLGRDAG